MASSQEPLILENGEGDLKGKEIRLGISAHNMPSSSLREKSEPAVLSRVSCGPLGLILTNLQKVILGSKLCVLFPVIPLPFIASIYNFGTPWVFAFSLIGLIPLAERVSFLTEQISFYTGPTAGGLLNATCGNATELIIALFALHYRKIEVVKGTLMGTVLSNLLLVLGASLFCGGLANLRKEQKFDRRPVDVSSLLLLLGLLGNILPLLMKYASSATLSASLTAESTLQLSRVSSIIMLLAYSAYVFFQLKTHRHICEVQDEDNDDEEGEEEAVIGLWNASFWLLGMTVVIAVLSDYLVDTIEDSAKSWGMSVSFIGLVLLPLAGDAAEHAGAIIFAFKNKLDITLGIALGSATQISIFVIPLTVVAAWIMGIEMDLDFNILETASFAVAVIITTFTLQDGTSHYMKGLVLLCSYFVIGACFFVLRTPPQNVNALNV